MKNRVKIIRQENGLTQSQFAEKIGLSRNYVAMIEIGQRDPSDRTISDICRVFGISEDWLRYGLEPMKPQRTRSEEIASLVENALNGSSEFKKAVIQAICSRTDQELEALDNLLREIYENLPKPEDAENVLDLNQNKNTAAARSGDRMGAKELSKEAENEALPSPFAGDI